MGEGLHRLLRLEWSVRVCWPVSVGLGPQGENPMAAAQGQGDPCPRPGPWPQRVGCDSQGFPSLLMLVQSAPRASTCPRGGLWGIRPGRVRPGW